MKWEVILDQSDRSCKLLKYKNGKEKIKSRQGIPLLLVLNRPCLNKKNAKTRLRLFIRLNEEEN